MRIHDLGPLRVEASGISRPLGGPRMEAVLAALVVHPGRTVPADRLIDLIWGESPPPRASGALDTLIWRLRRTLEPARPARAPSTVLPSQDQGYLLEPAAVEVDSWSVAAAVARPLPVDDDPLGTTESLLALWRGRPFEGVPDDGWLEPTRTALEGHRLTLLIRQAELLLDRGLPERAVTELTGALVEHPYAERLWELRIRGLHDAGRTGAALSAWAEVEALLRTELQTRPGAGLLAVREQLRSGSSTLSRSPGAQVTSGPVGHRAPFRVPVRRTTLIGRTTDIVAVRSLLDRRRQVSLVGPVGSGKTRLAIEVAAACRTEFRDGVFFVDLSDLDGSDAVADRVQETLGLPADPPRSAEQVVVDHLSSRSVLLILDNCEQVTAPTAALLDSLHGAAPVRVLVTSRHRIGTDGEAIVRVRPLAVPTGSDEQELRASPAAELLLDRLGDNGFDEARWTADTRTAVRRICAATDGLPLGLELAAALSPVLQLTEIADAVSAQPMSLGRLRDDPDGGLRESIERSHRLVGDDERAVHRRLSVLPSDFTLEAAVAVCADDLPATDVPAALAGLTHRSLLEAIGPTRPGGPSRFRQLVPLRAHAADELRRHDELDDSRRRHDEWSRQLLLDGPRHGRPGQADHFQRIDDNRRSITAALEAGVAAGPTEQNLFALCRLLPYWIDRMVGADAVRITTAARDGVTASNSPFEVALAVTLHAAVQQNNQTGRLIRDDLIGALAGLGPTELAERSPADRLVVADLLVLVAVACWAGDDYDLAARVSAIAARHGLELADPDITVTTAATEGLLAVFEDLASARARASDLWADPRLRDNNFARFLVCVAASVAAVLEGDGPTGLRWTAESLELSDLLGIRNIADTLETRGNHYVNAGMGVEAVRCWAAASLQNSRAGRSWPRHPGTAERLAGVRRSLSAADFDEAWAAGERLGADNLVDGWL